MIHVYNISSRLFSTVLFGSIEYYIFSKFHRSRRQQKVKFVGRRINHLWKESNNKTHWYAGTVLSVIHGIDGDKGAVHEVKYDDDDDDDDDNDDVYELAKLSENLRASQLKFIDI